MRRWMRTGWGTRDVFLAEAFKPLLPGPRVPLCHLLLCDVPSPLGSEMGKEGGKEDTRSTGGQWGLLTAGITHALLPGQLQPHRRGTRGSRHLSDLLLNNPNQEWDGTTQRNGDVWACWEKISILYTMPCGRLAWCILILLL